MDLLTFLSENQGLVVTLSSGFLLPIVLVWLNNRYNLKGKREEIKLQNDQQQKDLIKNQEKAVYGSLSKILFDVQQLYVSLSGSCVDKNCINDALSKFDNSIVKYHEEISDNMLYMSSSIIDDIYTFYGKISELKIHLKEFNDTANFEMAHVAVYFYSTELATILINLQDRILQKRLDIKIEFDRTQQEMMKYCCGKRPPEGLISKYQELEKRLDLKSTSTGKIKVPISISQK